MIFQLTNQGTNGILLSIIQVEAIRFSPDRLSDRLINNV